MTKKQNRSFGTITPAILIISSAFIIVIYGVLFALTTQFDFSRRQTASETAIHFAEAGINYYRWHLAHDPNDYTSDVGIHDYTDPQGDLIGQFNIEVTPPEGGSSIITITSTGYSNEFANIDRTIEAKYGQPSFSRFAYMSNSSSWYGTGITVNGEIRSNNGIRMDGTNNSLVSSAKLEYNCGTETGCFPPEPKPGVWGSGGDQGLWQFPVPSLDFDTLSFDFANMRDAAQDIGLYLDDSGDEGYHIMFFDNGSIRINRVLSTSFVRGYSVPGQGLGEEGAGGCRNLYQIITDEELVGTYNVSDAPILFAEDNLWVEGTVEGRITVIAARFPIISSNVDVWIPNSILYNDYDGSDALGLISQSDIFFARDVPEDFNVDGVLMAQSGKIIRHGYFNWCGGSSEAVKDKLTINGSLISYFTSYWNFGAAPDSGFIEREINYDSSMLFNPPPYFPTSGEFEIIDWIEK